MIYEFIAKFCFDLFNDSEKHILRFIFKLKSFIDGDADCFDNVAHCPTVDLAKDKTKQNFVKRKFRKLRIFWWFRCHKLIIKPKIVLVCQDV